jgi:FemAB-related protein (PEP-CTERM system-associated)
MDISVGSAPPGDWDAFVQAQPGHSPYHLARGVLIGRAAFGLDTTFLAARGPDGLLRGVLPLVEQSSPWFGRFLTSLPFFNYGGLLATCPEAVGALLGAAADLGRRRAARHVELRHAGPLPGAPLPERLDKVAMLLPLPADEAQLAKRLGAKLRSQVRRADREQPQVEWGGRELLGEFHRVFARGMRDLGTPVYPLGFFESFWAGLGEFSRVLLVRAGGETRAVALVVRHAARLEVPWAVATPEAKRASLNMRLYWEMLRHGVATGASEFDFGRSTRDSGTYRFKAQWGAEPRQLHWHYCLPAGAAPPVLNASNPRYSLASALWRRLPLWCANALGPRLVRHLP